MSHFLTSFAWLAGPLSGLFFQPIIGAISDRYTGRLEVFYIFFPQSFKMGFTKIWKKKTIYNIWSCYFSGWTYLFRQPTMVGCYMWSARQYNHSNSFRNYFTVGT